MNGDVRDLGTLPTAWMGGLRAVSGSVVPNVTGAGCPPACVAVQGPGGSGKSMLLAEWARAYAAAGLAVVGAHAAPDPSELEGGIAVVVDDAHLLTAEDAARVRALLGHPLAHVAVAYRPWPRSPALTELVAEMGSDRHMVVLGHVGVAVAARWADEQLGASAPTALVEFVHRQTGGLPALLHPLLRSLAARPQREGRSVPAPRIAPGQPVCFEVPVEVTDRVRVDLAGLDDDDRALLHAVTGGAPLDVDLLADLLEVPARRCAELIKRARASGLLLNDGTVVPLVGTALLGTTPADVTRSTRRRLLRLLLDRGDEPLELARSLAADGVRDPGAARVLEQHGDAALATDPALAGELLDQAVRTGANPAALAARRALAAALVGNFDAALQWAEPALRSTSPGDREQAAGVTAAVLAQRGLLARSAELYRLAGPDRAGSTALALSASGALAEAEAVLAASDGAGGGWTSTMLSGGERLMAQGVLETLRPGPSTSEDVATALSTLTRAAGLLEPVGRTALLIDTPAALAALVALHSGELAVAESVLNRALAAEVGGRPARPRHLLLLAWAAMLRGRMSSARDHLAGAEAGRGPLEPRDELFARALEVGLARRSSDLPGLVRAWERAREALLRHPVDLFSLLPLGELVIAAARLRESDRMLPYVTQAACLLRRLGDPQVWATSVHWSGLQAAILASDRVGLAPHATALVAAARTCPYAATLARAGRSWLHVLSDDVDATSVLAAAEGLGAVGLAWDGSRLAGQAAARTSDARSRTSLLQCARTLAEDDGSAATVQGRTPVPDGAATPPAGGQLSQREREVATLLVAGQTYREVGGKLFISAKTVEHHVSRIRQRLGASNRSDLLARLRAELAEGA